MKTKKYRERYKHVPPDFARRVKVLQAMWDMNASDFGWRIGLNLDYIHRYRQSMAVPTLAICSKIEHAAGLQTLHYLMARGPAPLRPRDNDGLKGMGSFEKARLAELMEIRRQSRSEKREKKKKKRVTITERAGTR